MIRQRLLLIATSSIFSLSAWAVEPEGSATMVGAWLDQLTHRIAEQDRAARSVGKPLPPGEYTITSIEDLEAPEQVKQYFRQRMRKGSVEHVPVGRLASVASLLHPSDIQVLSPAALRARLPTGPADISVTALRTARLVSTTSAGQSDGFRATGVSRLFAVGEAIAIELIEDSFRENRGARLGAFSESLNASVNGEPATRAVQFSDDGRVMVTLAWATPMKAFELRLMAEDGPRYEHHVSLLQQIADRLRQP